MCRRFDSGLRHHSLPGRNTPSVFARITISTMTKLATLLAFALFAIASAQGPVSAKASLAVTTPAVTRGGTAKATITLNVPAGHHAYAPAKENSDYIVVAVEAVKGAPYTVAATFPKGAMKTYPGVEHPVPAYEGKVAIPVSFGIPANASKGRLVVKAVVVSQVCSNSTGVCYPPKRQMVTGTISVR